MGNCKSVTRVKETEPTDRLQIMIRELRNNDSNNGNLHNNLGMIFYENVRINLSSYRQNIEKPNITSVKQSLSVVPISIHTTIWET
jgi:hypothetical protein